MRAVKTEKKNDKSEIVEALKALAKEKGISEELLFNAIEEALKAAYKKNLTTLFSWSGLLNQSLEGMSLIHTCSTPQWLKIMSITIFDKAAQQFANLMIEKIQQVEDNWQTVALPCRNNQFS